MPKALRDRTNGQLFAYTDQLASQSHQYEIIDFVPKAAANIVLEGEAKTRASAAKPAKASAKAPLKGIAAPVNPSPILSAADLTQVAPEVPPSDEAFDAAFLMAEPETAPAEETMVETAPAEETVSLDALFGNAAPAVPVQLTA